MGPYKVEDIDPWRAMVIWADRAFSYDEVCVTLDT